MGQTENSDYAQGVSMLSIKSNQIAQEIWNKKEFSKALSFHGSKEYKLTNKQLDLVTHFLKLFFK